MNKKFFMWFLWNGLIAYIGPCWVKVMLIRWHLLTEIIYHLISLQVLRSWLVMKLGAINFSWKNYKLAYVSDFQFSLEELLTIPFVC